MGLSLAGANDDVEKEEEAKGTAGRWGLGWDPEEGPVWGEMGDAEKAEQGDTWTQLLREGVSGITTHSDGENRNVCVCHCRSIVILTFCWILFYNGIIIIIRALG